MIKYIFYYISIFSILLFLSCYEQEIIINENLRGKLSFKVEYFKEFEDLINFISDNSDFEKKSKILFEKSKLKELILKSNGINLLKHSIKYEENKKESEVILSFDKYSQIPASLPNSYFNTLIYEKNNTIYCSTIISSKNFFTGNDLKDIYNKLSQEEKNTIDKYIPLIKLKFIYKTPTQIINNVNGRILNDKKTLIYEISLYELLNLSSDVEVNFSFKTE